MSTPITTVRACIRCHGRKVRCSGYPDCRSCRDAGLHCQPYARRKKADTILALKESQERVRWLESELSRNFGVECAQLPTGVSLRGAPQGASFEAINRPRAAQATPVGDHVQTSPPATVVSQQRDDNDEPNISLVTLNATGEQKYLGPSSGAFFASHAAAILRSYAESNQPLTRRAVPRADSTRRSRLSEETTDEQHQPLSPGMVQLLHQSYVLWIHPLYLVFSLEMLDLLMRECKNLQDVPPADMANSPERAGKMAMFYLVMALGATNYLNTITRLQQGTGTARNIDEALDHGGPAPSAASLYSKALPYLDIVAKDLRPSLTTIRVLLLVCIYSSYGPIGSSQWQLAGLAMRLAVEIGLHYAPKGRATAPSEVVNDRNSVFWTAFAIEIGLSYNLGRPPSIGEEHITADLPTQRSDTASGILHIKHRLIQSRIVSQVYGGAVKAEENTEAARHATISRLQSQLDDWRDSMATICPVNSDDSYPFSYWNRLYHGTTFVLHRTSPLCTSPSAESLERCLRSVGAYIDSISDVLRTSNVPLSWMLVQGVVFAGLTMVITARTRFSKLALSVGLPLLLADLPAWMRKCSVCLAIMRERVRDDLLLKLDTDFDVLADTTMRIILSGLTTSETVSSATNEVQGNSFHLSTMNIEEPQPAAAWMPAESWDDMGNFLDILGMNDSQTYWDIFSRDVDVNDVTLPWETGQ